jgi:hypothetical protein
MKNFSKVFLILVLAVAVLGTTIAFSEAGTKNDPLVSLSYLENKINELKEYVDKRISEVKEENKSVEAVSFEVVELSAGQSIIGSQGTEIILRGGTSKGVGRAEVVASGNDGLSDITDGKDIKSGQEVPLNHLLIVPRDDGRGVYAITDSVYLVKGDYEIR